MTVQFTMNSWIRDASQLTVKHEVGIWHRDHEGMNTPQEPDVICPAHVQG